jgi:hypothetical protein
MPLFHRLQSSEFLFALVCWLSRYNVVLYISRWFESRVRRLWGSVTSFTEAMSTQKLVGEI